VVIANPIILKELIQAAHHRRTYLLRAGFPALVAAILGFQLWDIVPTYGQDWRALAMVSRELFSTLVWVEFVALSLLGFVGATAVVHQEWANRTMEVLCATPLSRLQILHGKFVAVLSEVLMMALALLPVTAVLYYVGRLPQEMAVGSFAVTVGSVLLFSSLALLQVAASRPREGSLPVPFFLVGPLFLVPIYLDCFVFVRHPVLEGLIPPRALYLVLSASPPTGWSVGGFAALSLALMAGVSLGALFLAPAAFRLTLTRVVSGEVRRGWRARLRRLFRGRRPKMKPREDPFVWQEKGGATRLVRSGVWLLYGVLALFFAGGGSYYQDFDFLKEEGFYLTLLFAGLVGIILCAAAYAAAVFAREKSQRTVEALLLTGHRPARYYWAKLRALYWALRYSLLIVGLVILFWFAGAYFLWESYYMRGGGYGYVGRSAEEVVVLVGLLELLLVGPALAAVIGLAFSALSRTPQRSAGAIVMGGLLAIGLGFLLSAVSNAFFGWDWDPGDWLVSLIIVVAVFFALNRTWTPFRLSLLLGLHLLLFVSGEFAVGEFMNGLGSLGDAWQIGVFILGTNVVVGTLVLLWLLLGLRTFDAGLAGEPARLLWRRRRPAHEGSRRSSAGDAR